MNAQQAAVRLLARREHSRHELKTKLLNKGWPEDEIDVAMDWLLEHDLQSDSRFAESYINMRKARGYGPLRIAAELKQRGIDETMYGPVLNANDVAWSAILRELHNKKYHGEVPDDYAERSKQIRFLQHRGFALENILEVMSESKISINTI